MTDPVRESSQASQAPRRNVAAKTSLATDLSLIAVFAGFIAALAIMPAVSLGGVAVPFTFQTLGIYITAQVLGGKRATASVALYLLWCRLARGAAKKHSYPLVRHIVCL